MSVNGQETKMTIHGGRGGHRPILIYGSSAEGMPADAPRYDFSDPEAPGRTKTTQAPTERGIHRILRFLQGLIPSIDPASRVQR